MKIALYYPWLYLKSGGERTVVEILARSRHKWQIITNHYDKESTYPELKNAPIVELAKVSVRRTFLHAGLAALRMLAQKLPIGNADALVIACDGLGDLVTFRNHDVPVISLCFTPLRAAFDPYYRERYLEMHGNSSIRRVALSAAMRGFRTVDRLACRHYSHIFAISEEVRRRILLGRLVEPEKVSIAYPGVDLSHARPSGVYNRYFLVAGRIMWTKNADLAIRAFQSFRQMRPDLHDFRLVIAGFVDQKSRPYIDYLRKLGGDCQNIEFVESPSDSRLNDLYQRAYAVLYTPFNEDWGLIPLEAMAFEKPILAVDRGGPRETIAHGETGFLLPPEPDAFAKTMELLADDPQMPRRMGVAGRLSTRRFEWKEFCNTIDDQLERVSAVNAPLCSLTDSRVTPRAEARRLNSETGCQPDR
jgi:glycosyltransferase involved in cell wall biosynthesis